MDPFIYLIKLPFHISFIYLFLSYIQEKQHEIKNAQKKQQRYEGETEGKKK